MRKWTTRDGGFDYVAYGEDYERRTFLPVTDPDHPEMFRFDGKHHWDIYWGGYEYSVDNDRVKTALSLLSWVHHLLGKSGWPHFTAFRLKLFMEAVCKHNQIKLYGR